MHEAIDNTVDLLGLIYETAHDPTFWPLLLDGLNRELDAATANFSKIAGSGLEPDNEQILVSPSPVFSDMFPASFETKNRNQALSAEEHILAARLIPHFKRALALNRQYVDIQAQRRAALTILDQVPIGVFFVTRQARIVVQNKRA